MLKATDVFFCRWRSFLNEECAVKTRFLKLIFFFSNSTASVAVSSGWRSLYPSVRSHHEIYSQGIRYMFVNLEPSWKCIIKIQIKKPHKQGVIFSKPLVLNLFQFMIYSNLNLLRKNCSNLSTFRTANILMTLCLYQFGKVKKYKQCAFPACVNFKHVVLN